MHAAAWPRQTRWVVGCMTGTSLDGLDAALVRIDGRGLSIRGSLAAQVSLPLGDLGAQLRSIAEGAAVTAAQLRRAAARLGRLHVHAVAHLAQRTDRDIDLVVAHGQTIWHGPGEHLSFQLFDPWPVVRALGVPVVHDLRGADLVAGGQGAPITPLADWLLMRDNRRHRVVVNLGGIINVTDLPPRSDPDDVSGEDIGPCNLLLDGLVRRLLPGRDYDDHGELAARGRPFDGVTQILRTSPFFARPRPRTTGREDFSQRWLDELLAAMRQMWGGRAGGDEGPDILASAVHGIADLIVDDLNARRRENAGLEVVLAGGGTHNLTLMDAITTRLGRGATVLTSDELGVPVSMREAMAMATLGALAADEYPITLPQVTGARTTGRPGVWVYP